MNSIKNFIQEIKEELSKITYPTKEAVKNATISITVIVISTAIYMEVLDFLIKGIYKYVLKISI